MIKLISMLLPKLLEWLARVLAIFFIGRWSKEKQDLKAENETLKDSIGTSDNEFSRRLRERAAKKRKDRD